jgi:hypothetical protein
VNKILSSFKIKFSNEDKIRINNHALKLYRHYLANFELKKAFHVIHQNFKLVGVKLPFLHYILQIRYIIPGFYNGL